MQLTPLPCGIYDACDLVTLLRTPCSMNKCKGMLALVACECVLQWGLGNTVLYLDIL